MAQGGKREGAGRKRGSVSVLKSTVEGILNSLNCDPISGLARIAKATEKKSPQVSAYCYAKLANKIHPDKKALEHTGKDGGPIQAEIGISMRLRSVLDAPDAVRK